MSSLGLEPGEVLLHNMRNRLYFTWKQ